MAKKKAEVKVEVVSDMLTAKVRLWRETNAKLTELKPLMTEANRVEKDEKELRYFIGEALETNKTITVDEKALIYARSQRNYGMDYEGAWKMAMLTLSVRSRKKMETFLQPKTTPLHKLTTEE